MHRLADEFRASIKPRPLLVEAAIASEVAADGSATRWVVLIDSERFRTSAAEIKRESTGAPLESRLRTTIAHELLHTLTMRKVGDGVLVDLPIRKGENRGAYLKRIERETERWTSLLLIPDSVVTELAESSAASLDQLISMRRKQGVSREMLIGRFEILGRSDPRMHGTPLQNLAVGMIGSADPGNWQFLPRPLFHNFESNRLPWLIQKLLAQKPLSVSDVTTDPALLLNGGEKTEIEFDGHAPTEKLPYMKMRVRLSIERVNTSRKHPFLFTLRRLR